MAIPATNRKEDIEAARDSMFSYYEPELWSNTWWRDPILVGKYPEDGLKVFQESLPEIGPDHLRTIYQPIDFLVRDPQRIDFLHRYLREYQKASEEGIETKGYFCWSLMDNFEWAEGYNERFGLVYVDYQTMKRTIKDSGYWYKRVIETNGEILINKFTWEASHYDSI